MKKIAFVCSVLFLTLCLTSCEVHWFGKSYDTPWWTIAIPVTLIFVATWFFAGKIIAKKEYRCPKCQKNFHPTWWKAAFSVHVNDDRVFQCPHCGKKSLCKPTRD